MTLAASGRERRAKLRILAAASSLHRLHADVTDLDDATLLGRRSPTQLRELHLEGHAGSQRAVEDLRGAPPTCLLHM